MLTISAIFAGKVLTALELPFSTCFQIFGPEFLVLDRAIIHLIKLKFIGRPLHSFKTRISSKSSIFF